MKKLLFFFTFALLALPSLYAQYYTNQNKVWAFGTEAGLNFTSGSPVAFRSAINTDEGCAYASDATGSLLFYTDGYNIYNRAGSIMPTGGAIVSFSTSSTSQGSLVVPVIGSTSKYYVFSLESLGASTGLFGHLEYCIVDMTLDGGLGDVISSTIGTLIDTGFGEHLIAVQGNSCDIWLVAHKQSGINFYCYNINSTGISSTPVISSVGTFTAAGGYSIGQFKISPDRTKLASTSYNDGSYVPNGVGSELYDFNATTGVVSNCRRIDSLETEYGVEISPDNTKLYTETFGGAIYQYDISSGVAATIRASRYTVASTSWSGLKIGPDGKIYFTTSVSSSTLDHIANPNTSGSGCGFATAVVTLTSGTNIMYGLPNMFVTVGAGDTVYKSFDTVVCLPPGNTISLTADTTGSSYLWSTGTNMQTANISAIGNYWVLINNGCQLNIDTFHVTQKTFDTTVQRMDTSVCQLEAPITLNAASGYTTYQWNDGSSASSISVNVSGVSYVNCFQGCTMLADTFHVTVVPYVLTSNIIDTSYCFPGQLLLLAPAGASNYTWQDLTNSAHYYADSAGTYYVDGSSYCADKIDTFHVAYKSLSFSLGPDQTVCMDAHLTIPITGAGVTYLWQDGTTDSSYYADHTGIYYATVRQNECVASDTVNITFDYISQNIPDTTVCKGVPFIYDVACTVQEPTSIMWNDGITSPTRSFTDSGTWYVFISKGQCEILDTVHVYTEYCNCWYDVPSGFTPNNDGLNDVFRPTIQPGCTISGYTFSIFNRWGEQIFTSDMQHKGWDGTYKGVPVDIGTYMYLVQFYIGVNNTPVNKTGTLTLIR